MAAAFAMTTAIYKPNLLLRRTTITKPTICAATSNQSHFTSHLLHSLPTTLHPSIQSPIQHILSSSTPPTIAPSLCLAASELVGSANPTLAQNTAYALHLIHAAIHTHTSLINRKPLPQFSSGTQLMTADGLLTLAFEMVTRTPGCNAEENTCLLKVLVEVTTTAAAVAAVDEDEREGELAACAAACGVILGGGSEEEVEKARRLGMLVGKKGLDLAKIELDSGFEEVRIGSLELLLQNMVFTDQLLSPVLR